MICILGDLHFRSDKDYFIATCENVLSWFREWKFNSEKNELILAGDLVEQATPGGLTISFLEKFVSYSRFRKIHICVGNHDDKKINGIQQLAYEFLSNKLNVIIYRVATETIIGDKKVLILPYFTGINDSGMTMREYYSSIYKNPLFKNNYDLVVGHFSGPDVLFSDSPDCASNLEKLNGRICLGHIHTRNINPKRYIGSIFACKKSENDYTRAAWICDKSGKWSEDPLPLFNEFISVTYPQELPDTKALVPIYTVLNCGSEKIAKQKYGNIFIRRSTAFNNEDSKSSRLDLDRSFKPIKAFNIRELFNIYAKEACLDPEVVSKCEKYLKN